MRNGTSRTVWGFTTCLCCLVVIALALQGTARATPPVGKSVKLSLVGPSQMVGQTQIAYSTNTQQITKLSLHNGAATIPATGDKLVLYVDNGAAGAAELHLAMPNSPKVNVTVHLDGKIRADIDAVDNGKPSEAAPVSLGKSKSPSSSAKPKQAHVNGSGSVTTKSHSPVNSATPVRFGPPILGTQMEQTRSASGKPYFRAKSSQQDQLRGCSVACPPGATVEVEPDCGLPTDTVNGGCNSASPVFSPIACGETVCGTAAFDGSFRDTDWYKLVLTQATQVTWSGEAEYDLLIGIVNNFGIDSCAGVTSFLTYGLGGPCTPTSVTACLPAGTWYLFIAPDFVNLVSCGAHYTASVTCADCPPAAGNDACSGAENLPCGGTVIVDNSAATTDALDPAYSCHFGGPAQGVGTLWYTFVATATSANLTTCNSTGTADTLLAVYSGTCGSLTEIACNDDASCGPLGYLSTVCANGLTVGNTYYVQVATYSDADRGSITLELTCPCGGGGGPPGDACEDAIALTIPADVTGSTIGAGFDSPPAFGCVVSIDSPGLWYTVVGDGNTLTASLCNPGTDYDTKINIYCGTCAGFSCVTGDDDFCGYPPGHSQASWCSAGGTTYYILVQGYGGNTGNFELTVTSDGVACGNPPFCGGGSCEVTCDPGKTDENEPNCGLPSDTVNGGCNSVPPVFSPITCGQSYCGTAAFDGSLRDTDWYELTLTQNTQITWSVEAEFDVLVGIVDNQGGALDCSQVSAFLVYALGSPCQPTSVSRCLSAGTWWLFVAPDFTNTVACGAVYNASVTCAECPPGPPNDHCEDAEMILCNSTTTVDNTLATTDATDPVYSCHFGGPAQGVGTLWYTFVATDTSARVSTCNSGVADTLIAVYSGTCGSLTEIACNDDFCGDSGFLAQVCAQGLTVGQTYYVQLSSYDSASLGTLSMDLACPCPAGPPGDMCQDAIALTLPADVTGTTVGSTPDSPPAFTCGGFAVTAPGNWYTVVGNGTELTASLCNPGTSYDTRLFVYCGSCAELFCVGGDDDFCGYPPGYSQVSWCSANGTTYYILVSGYSNITGDYELTVTSGAACSDPPSCAPCTITCTPDKTDENEPNCGLPNDTVNGGCNSSPPVFSPIVCGQKYCGTAAFDGSLRDTDWYELTLTQNTQVTWTVEADFDVVVGIVDNGGGALDCSQVTSFLVVAVGTPCQSTNVSACLTAGTWWLFVAPDFTATLPCGALYNAELTCGECAPGPSNDHCEDAEMILCNSTTNTDTTLATNDPTDPIYSCHFGGPAGGVGTLWYTFVATNSSARLSTCGSASTDTLLAVYSGTCGSLTEIACNDDMPCGPTGFLSELCVTGLTVGSTYYVQVSAYSNADRGPVELVLQCPCPGVEPTGACCVNGNCSITTQSACAGDYLGDGTNCNSSGGTPSVYVSNPNAAIPDNTPAGISDTINVPDSLTIGDLNVDLVVTHTYVGDLVVTLTHGVTTVTLIDRPGVPAQGSFGCSNDNYNIILDDQGTGGSIENLCSASMVSPPNYTPNNPLAAFNGANASGPWILTISDNAGQDVGTLVQWSLHIDVPGQSPCNIEPCDDCPAGTIPIVDSNGDNSGWCVSASDPANVVIHVDDVDRTAGIARLRIDKNFVNPPGFGGLIPCILLDFVQVCPDLRTVDTIVINGETIINNTGVNWQDFHWILFDGPEAWFDVAASSDFDVLPFMTKLFNRFLDPPANTHAKRLDVYNGVVPAGGTFSPSGGTVVGGNPVDVVANPNLAIPDNTPAGVSDSVNVADSITISDLNVDLKVTHTYVGDLIVTLTHGVTTVTLIDRPGVPALGSFGCSNDNYDIILDDQGSGGPIENLCSASMVSPPNYTPNNPLAAFNGANSSGMWTITISDNAGQDVGTLVQWSLHMTAASQTSGEPLTIGVDLSGPPVSFTLKECPTTTGAVTTGACCIGLDCTILTPTDCANSLGQYKGDGSVCTPGICLPANDECNNCISVQTGVAYNGSTLGATGSDISSCAFNDTIDVWHCWTATCTGTAVFSLCGSSFDTTLAVYAGCGGAELGCNDDDTGGCSPQSKLSLNVVAGQTYYIRVSGFNGDAGQYSLTVTCTGRQNSKQQPKAVREVALPGQ